MDVVRLASTLEPPFTLCRLWTMAIQRLLGLTSGLPRCKKGGSFLVSSVSASETADGQVRARGEGDYLEGLESPPPLPPYMSPKCSFRNNY